MRRVFSVVIVCLLCLSMLSVLSPEIVPRIPRVKASAGSVGYWNFDEGVGTVAGDSSGNGNDGTLANGPAWVTGISGTALSFDGKDDYVAVPHSPSLDISGDKMSVEFWMRPLDDLPHPGISTTANVFDKGDAYVGTFNLDPASPDYGRLQFSLPFSSSPTFILSTTNRWNRDKWYHLAFAYDGSNMRLYVNGFLENTIPKTGNIHSSGFQLSIGSYTLGTSGFFHGILDEFAIYDYARTTGEIRQDYDSLAFSWTKCFGNPLDLGSNVEYPAVVFDGSMYKMWYCLGDDIHYATSQNGVDWQTQGAVLIGSDNSWGTHLERVSVILDEGTYKMWYSGYNSTEKLGNIGYAYSFDGVTWTKYDGPVLKPGGNGGWDNWNVLSPNVLKDGPTYKMWYVAQNVRDSPVLKIGYASSSDGVVWTKYAGNPVLNPGENGGWDDNLVTEPVVIWCSDHYDMWYMGHQSTTGEIGLATSDDGLLWTKHIGNPLLTTGSEGSWDSQYVIPGSIVYDGTIYMMWYTGVSATGETGIGLAYCPSACVPSAPRGLGASPGLSSIELGWDDPTEGLPIQSFRIYRGVSSGSETFLASVDGSVHRYVDSTVPLSLCFYYVTAVNLGGESPPSNEVKCSTEESLLGVETVVSIENFKVGSTKNSIFYGTFTVQQNFEIAVGGSLIHRYWAQNTIWITPPMGSVPSLMVGITEIRETNDGGINWNTIIHWSPILVGLRAFKNPLILRSTIEGDKLIMNNNCKNWTFQLAKNSYIIGIGPGAPPEIAIVGPLSRSATSPGTVVFKNPTNGHVSTYARIGNIAGAWLNCDNIVRTSLHTAERSQNLKWTEKGDFSYQEGATDQGLWFWPDFNTPIVSPP